MATFIIAIIVLAGAGLRVLYEQQKKREDADPVYLPPTSRSRAVSSQREWNGFLDARGAHAFWSFGDSAADPDWVEVIIGPVAAGLILMPKQYRPTQPAPPITVPWDTVISATRGTESQADARPGSSLESAAVIKLNLHALGEPGAYNSGELAIIRCFGKTGSILVTEVNKHLYGRVTPRPNPATRSTDPNLPPPTTLPPPQGVPRPAPPASQPTPRTVPAPPPVYRPISDAPAMAAIPIVTPTSPEPVAPVVDIGALHPPSDLDDVPDVSDLDAAAEAIDFDESTSLDALTPATIELSSFDAPLDLTAYSPDTADEPVATPLVAAPWPPPVAFVLPDPAKVTDEQQ